MLSNAAFRLLTAPDALSKLLGPLEIEIMRIMWQGGERTVKELHGMLAPLRDRAYTTIMTTTARLAEKGMLRRADRRQGVGGAYIYSAAISEQDFISQVLTNIVDAMVRDYPAALVDYLETHRASTCRFSAKVMCGKRERISAAKRSSCSMSLSVITT
jgi:predicted transcriptional regulator